jgi:hypothetical protein|tara:strand:+ start:11169 stop:11366 length:198 start_codon:yes stop_codon:yes gene_type:complete
MTSFKKFYSRINKKKTKRSSGATYPSSASSQNFNNAVNYVNTPPYGSPPSVGGFTDSNFPGYPST